MRTSRRVRAFVWSAARMLPSALLGISGLAVGFVARPACPAVGDTGAEPLTFFVTSDCHYKSGDKAAFNERNHATVLRMNSLPGSEFPDKVGGGKIGRPRGVLALGDLVDDGDRAGQTEPQWRSFVADFGLDGTDGVLRFPVFEGWGNHDGPPAAAAKGGFSVQAQIRERNQARRAKGLIANLSANGLHYSWDSGGVHFVQLNLYPGDRYHPQSKYSAVWHDPQMSLSFLTEDLRKNVASSGRPVVLAAHAGFDTDWWHRDEWKAFYDAVKPYNVIAYFHGHTGTGIYKWKPEGEEKPLDVVNTGQTENGFFVVEVGESRLRLGYYRKNVRNKEWDGTWDWQHFLQKTIQRAAPPQPAAAPGRPTAAPGEEGAAHRPAEAPGPGAAADKGRSEASFLLREDFSKGMDNWWVEGGQRVWIQDGRLHVQADPPQGRPGQVCTVWCRQEFRGDLRVEFDCHVMESRTEANNINFFLLYSDPAGKPLRDTRDSRADAAYDKYHNLNGYIFTFLNDREGEGGRHPDGTAKARFRIRRCPGFTLLAETFAGRCLRGTTYRVAIVRAGTLLSIAVDGKVCLEARDERPHESGLIGLRTFQTHLWFDNLEVTRVEPPASRDPEKRAQEVIYGKAYR